MTRRQRRAAERTAAKLARKAASSASQAQINSDRENATHSTGAKTEAGKATVSQNRITHALNYNAATFRVLPCEDQADYDTLLKSFQEEHQP